MSTQTTLSAPRLRATEALEMIADQYGTPDALEALKAAGDDWHAEALAQVCEAVSAILLDLRPRTGIMKRERR